MRVLLLLLFSLFIHFAHAQLSPVKWSFEAEKVSNSEVRVIASAEINHGWYVYSQFIDHSAGPVPTQLQIEKNTTISLIGQPKEAGLKKEEVDATTGKTLLKFKRMAKFSQHLSVKDGTNTISGTLTYMTCDESGCLPPEEIPFSVEVLR